MDGLPGAFSEMASRSCAAVNIDSFMERNYLVALAEALHVPDDVRDDMMNKFRQPQPQHAGF